MSILATSLSDMLRRELIDLARVEQVAVLDVPTLTEATQRLVARLLGRRSWVTDHSPHLGGCMVVINVEGLAIAELAAAGPPGLPSHGHQPFVGIKVPLFDNAVWQENTLSGEGAPAGGTDAWSENFDARFALLYGVCNGATIISAFDVLTDPDTALPRHLSRRQAATLAWWQARLNEGQTPESARLLLGLIANPHVAALIEWLPDGTPAPAQP